MIGPQLDYETKEYILNKMDYGIDMIYFLKNKNLDIYNSHLIHQLFKKTPFMSFSINESRVSKFEHLLKGISDNKPELFKELSESKLEKITKKLIKKYDYFHLRRFNKVIYKYIYNEDSIYDLVDSFDFDSLCLIHKYNRDIFTRSLIISLMEYIDDLCYDHGNTYYRRYNKIYKWLDNMTC